MIESELGDWRRTHYSNQLGSDLEESIVTIMGWVSTVRGHGNISQLIYEEMFYKKFFKHVMKCSK